jgi:hypothetical protein
MASTRPAEEKIVTAPRARDNLDLAESAREIADSAPAGSLKQAAAGSVAVTCATTRDVSEAEAVLEGVTPDDVRLAALELLGQLSGEERPQRPQGS